ncbi:MAG: hypothetical protein SFT92_02055 [Rickettsiales bacterium]|nr:hypothetical protein [Rickettsiales bacterium]
MPSTDNTTPSPPAAVILRFPRRRGRPKQARPRRDLGTPELMAKRLRGETSEALDLCLARGIITERQHWCGVHLRWLYTIRYGAPGVRAVDPSHMGGRETRLDDPAWRNARDDEYNEAMRVLTQSGLALILLNLCVHNERPRFLTMTQKITKARATEIERQIELIQSGLDRLAKLWKRRK